MQHLLNTTSKPRPGTARFATSEGAYKGVMNALAAGVSPTIDGLTENLTPVEEVEIDLVEAAIRGSIQAMLVEKFELGRVY